MPKAGSYVVAVSGGVDSMALLHYLLQQPELRLTVAHYDHGIRPDSAKDRKLAQSVANAYKLPFVYHEGRLGPDASEAKARAARYDFLKEVKKASGARAIITAHHQDDLLETAILNMLRGTGRKGLTALKSTDDITRPLLRVPKSELRAYAEANGLKWREDPSNADLSYLRNYVRHKLLSRFSQADKANLTTILNKLTNTNQALDDELAELIDEQSEAEELNRDFFNSLPHQLALEVLAAWLRAHELRGFDRPTLERLVVAAKTGGAGKVFPVFKGSYLEVNNGYLALRGLER